MSFSLPRVRVVAGTVTAVAALGLVAALLSPAATAAPVNAQATEGCPPAPSFEFTVPEQEHPASVAELGEGLVSISAVGADEKAYTYIADMSKDPLEVGPLECLDGERTFDRIGEATGRGQLFALGTANRILFRQFDVDALMWGPWTAVPRSSASTGVTAVALFPDRTDIFYVSRNNPNGGILHQWQIGSTWFGPENLGGGSFEAPSVTFGADGQFHVWVTGTNNGIFVNAATPGGRWAGWRKISTGGSAHRPAATVGFTADGAREDVFLTGTNGGLFQGTFTNLGRFSGWIKLDTNLPATARLSASSASPGRLVVIATADGETNFKRYLSGWRPFVEAAYLCPTCVPTTGQSATQAPQRTDRRPIATRRSTF